MFTSYLKFSKTLQQPNVSLKINVSCASVMNYTVKLNTGVIQFLLHTKRVFREIVGM
jgi:hypothetical protein